MKHYYQRFTTKSLNLNLTDHNNFDLIPVVYFYWRLLVNSFTKKNFSEKLTSKRIYQSFNKGKQNLFNESLESQ